MISAALSAFLILAIATAVGFFAQRLIWPPKSKKVKPGDYGRAYLSYAVLVTTVASTHFFIQKGVVEGILGLVASNLIFGTLAYAAGYILALIKIRLQKNAETTNQAHEIIANDTSKHGERIVQSDGAPTGILGQTNSKRLLIALVLSVALALFLTLFLRKNTTNQLVFIGNLMNYDFVDKTFTRDTVFLDTNSIAKDGAYKRATIARDYGTTQRDTSNSAKQVIETDCQLNLIRYVSVQRYELHSKDGFGKMISSTDLQTFSSWTSKEDLLKGAKENCDDASRFRPEVHQSFCLSHKADLLLMEKLCRQ